MHVAAGRSEEFGAVSFNTLWQRYASRPAGQDLARVLQRAPSSALATVGRARSTRGSATRVSLAPAGTGLRAAQEDSRARFGAAERAVTTERPPSCRGSYAAGH